MRIFWNYFIIIIITIIIIIIIITWGYSESNPFTNQPTSHATGHATNPHTCDGQWEPGVLSRLSRPCTAAQSPPFPCRRSDISARAWGKAERTSRIANAGRSAPWKPTRSPTQSSPAEIDWYRQEFGSWSRVRDGRGRGWSNLQNSIIQSDCTRQGIYQYSFVRDFGYFNPTLPTTWAWKTGTQTQGAGILQALVPVFSKRGVMECIFMQETDTQTWKMNIEQVIEYSRQPSRNTLTENRTVSSQTTRHFLHSNRKCSG